jgi:hypothetical protein
MVLSGRGLQGGSGRGTSGCAGSWNARPVGGGTEVALAPHGGVCGTRALECDIAVVAWQSSVLFLLALIDYRFLQILELKCTKVQIAKLWIKGPSTTFIKVVLCSSQWFE